MKKKTLYHIILDQSGSMQDSIAPTISGFNEQLQVIQSLTTRFPDQEIAVGLTRFNEEVMPDFYAQPPAKVEPLTPQRYVPCGCTALFDAIGTTVLRIREDLAADLKQEGTSVIVVILTDGYENSSRHFNLSGIRNLIRELEGTGKWTFTYLGATIDAVEVASQMNIRKQNSMAFDKSEMNASYEILNESLGNFFSRKQRNLDTKDFLKKDPE